MSQDEVELLIRLKRMTSLYATGDRLSVSVLVVSGVSAEPSSFTLNTLYMVPSQSVNSSFVPSPEKTAGPHQVVGVVTSVGVPVLSGIVYQPLKLTAVAL